MNDPTFLLLRRLILAFALTLCVVTASASDYGCNRNAADRLIVPGRCIGKICISMTTVQVQKMLGPPSFSQVIRGNVLEVWRSARSQYLFVVLKKGVVIDIHVTSPHFHTCENISTASSLTKIKQDYPQGISDIYNIFATGKNRFDWVVKKSGITFTFADDADGPMVRLAVHRPGYEKAVGYSQDDDLYWYPSESNVNRQGQ